jgi:nucleoside 2-deoxyribosyltransferase
MAEVEKRINIYFAAPLFTTAERRFNKDLASAIVHLGPYDVYLPQEAPDDPATSESEIFANNVDKLRTSEVVVAICDGPITDDGTSYEVGRARERGIPVVAVRTDTRGHEDMGFNLMFRDCIKVRVKPTCQIDALASLIHEAIQRSFTDG